MSNTNLDWDESYRPTEDEPYMNSRQREYFRRKLLRWRGELLAESNQALERMRQEPEPEADPLDSGVQSADRAFELRSRDRARKLIRKIDEALERIADGTYGYCEASDEPIGVKRLEARPVATLCLAEQERKEREERARKGY